MERPLCHAVVTSFCLDLGPLFSVVNLYINGHSVHFVVMWLVAWVGIVDLFHSLDVSLEKWCVLLIIITSIASDHISHLSVVLAAKFAKIS